VARTEEHFIWTDDYAARLNNLEHQARAAKEDSTPLLGGEADPLLEIAEQYEALKAEADAAGLRVVLRGLRDDEWDELIETHPPRTEDQFESDKKLGFNEKTGTRALVHAALVEPKFDSRSRFDDWIREHNLTRGDVAALGAKAWALTNGMGYSDPKSLRPLPTRDADED